MTYVKFCERLWGIKKVNSCNLYFPDVYCLMEETDTNKCGTRQTVLSAEVSIMGKKDEGEPKEK